MMKFSMLLAAVALVIVGTARAQVVAGQGSSAQRDLGLKFNGLKCAGVAGVKYTPTSSVLGIAAVKAGGNTGVDFALSDLPDTPCSAASPLLNVPYGLGLIAVHARPSTFTGLRLSACALDRIYKCTARTWSDPVLGALNPRLKTYAKPIVKIARKEVSGTTFVFTNFLGKACPGSWKFGSITLLSNAAALRPCFNTMTRAAGNGGVRAAFGAGAAGPQNVIAYTGASFLDYGEVALQARVGGAFFTPTAVNPNILVAGLVYGLPTCSRDLDVTAKGATYPMAYVAFFLVNKRRRGRPNIAGVKNLCSCIANTKNQLLFTGLKDFRGAPAPMKSAAVARCNAILLT